MQPRYGWKRGSLPSDPKETVSEGWAWTGLGGQEVCSWCICFQEHFSFYSHFPFPPFFHLDHPMQEGGNQAVCLSAWSSFWQIKRVASLSRKAFPIVVVGSGWILVENIRLATNNLILWGWYLSVSNFISYRLEVCETEKIHLGSSWNIVHIHRIYHRWLYAPSGLVLSLQLGTSWLQLHSSSPVIMS